MIPMHAVFRKHFCMKFDIITIFPEAFRSYFSLSILARAQARKYITIALHDLRSHANDRHRTVDGRPYGGGAGMVMRADIAGRAIASILPRSHKVRRQTRVVMFTPQGKRFTQADAKRLSRYGRIILLSGRYEGYDERIRAMADEEISLGDFILTGGELPAMTVVDSVSRLIPGILGKQESLEWESFSELPKEVRVALPKNIRNAKKLQLLEYPQYTRPETLVFRGKKLRVPQVLRTGHHAQIMAWRLKQALARTKSRRPDLLT